METTTEDREDLCDSTIVKKEFEAKMDVEDAPTSTDDDERDFHDDIHPLEAVKVELHIKEEGEAATSFTFNENIQKYLEASASGGALRCCFCNRQFEQKFLLKRHLHTHMENRPSFSCKFCGNTYIWMVSLRRHLKKCQQKSQKRQTCVAQYRCSTCWKRFNQEIYLTEHQKVCSGKAASTSQNSTMQNSNQPPDAASVAFEKLSEAKMECDVCLKKFKNRDFFEKHQGIHTLLQTPHNCNFCGNTYKYRASLVRHQLLCEVMDEQTLPYTCPDCGNCFNQVFSLTQHRKVCGKQSSTGGEKSTPKNSPNVHKEKEIASKEVKNENGAPKEISRPFTCKICGNTYRHSHSMKRHQQLCKQMGVAPKYSCSICGNKFHDKISMGQHWRVCRGHLKKGADVGKPKISTNLIKLPKRRPGLYPCETCGRTYTWEMNLRRHQRTCVKPLAGDLLHFSCQKCGSRFNGQISLDKHAKICSSNTSTNDLKKEDVVHLEEKRVNLKKPLLPYACKVCGNTYKHRASRFRHQKVCETMAGMPQFVCTGCGNKFHEANSLEQHRNICSGLIDNLRKQEATHHGNEMKTKRRSGVFPCESCGKIYAWKFTLRRHQRKCQNAAPQSSSKSSQLEEHPDLGTMDATGQCEQEAKPESVAVAPKGHSTWFTCKNCGNAYKHNRSMTRHQRICAALGIKPRLTCQSCGNKFHNQFTLLQHKKACSDSTPAEVAQKKRIRRKRGSYACGSCGNVYEWRYTMIRHQLRCEKMDGIPQFLCKTCGNKFYQENSLNGHAKKCAKRKKEAEEMNGESVESTVTQVLESEAPATKSFTCNLCGNTYKYRSGLYRHKVTCKEKMETGGELHEEQNDQNEPQSHVSVCEKMHPSPQYVCIICEINFDGKTSFDAHIDSCRKLFWDTKDDSSDESEAEPEEEDIKIFECSICSKSFKSKTDMMDHAVTHMKNKPAHTCQKCGNTYAWKRNLIKHTEHCGKNEKSVQEMPGTSHTNAAPEFLKCPMCPKKFKHNFNLKKHLITHSTKKNVTHTCKFCGNKYRHSTSLKRHQSSCKVAGEAARVESQKNDKNEDEDHDLDALFDETTDENDGNDEDIDVTALQEQSRNSQAPNVGSSRNRKTNFVVKIEEKVVEKNSH